MGDAPESPVSRAGLSAFKGPDAKSAAAKKVVAKKRKAAANGKRKKKEAAEPSKEA